MRAEYIASNLELVDDFESVLMARELSREHMPYAFEESLIQTPDGWGTLLIFELADNSGDEERLRRRLQLALRDWTVSEERTRLDFCKADALIGFDFRRGDAIFEVYIDHEYARPGIRTTPCHGL